MIKNLIKCKYGTFDLELHEDGSVVVSSFQKKEPITGLGDVVAAATSAVGIRPCGGCKKRQQAMNQMFPFGQNPAGGETKSQ